MKNWAQLKRGPLQLISKPWCQLTCFQTFQGKGLSHFPTKKVILGEQQLFKVIKKSLFILQGMLWRRRNPQQAIQKHKRTLSEKSTWMVRLQATKYNLWRLFPGLGKGFLRSNGSRRVTSSRIKPYFHFFILTLWLFRYLYAKYGIQKRKGKLPDITWTTPEEYLEEEMETQNSEDTARQAVKLQESAAHIGSLADQDHPLLVIIPSLKEKDKN